MHLAFITSLVTDGKPTTGFEVANEAIVSGLRATGCKVTEIGFRQPRQIAREDSQTIVLDTLAVENASAAFSQKLLWMAGALASGLPIGGSKLRVVSWAQLENALKSLGDIDGIVINSVQMPTAFPQLLDFAPYIYVAHNVEHLSAQHNAASAGGALNRFLYKRDARLLEPIERKLCKNARHVFFLSDDDQNYFGLDNTQSSVLQLLFSEQTNDQSNDPAEHQDSHDVGLIGTWSWQPNFVGLKWFLDDVVPHLDKDMTISIAGGAPQSVSSAHPGVKFFGRVENAENFVKSSSVLALVSRSGTGVQLKTIEAFQMGMPCCATSPSVRGISTVPANCSIADDAKAFAGSLNAMVQRVKSGNSLQLDGRNFTNNQRKALHAGLRAGVKALGST